MRKTGLILVTGIAIVLLLSASGGGGGASSATAVAASGVCAGAPVRGGNLVYERQAATETLDPLNIVNGNGDIFSYNLIYSGLVRSDPNGGANIEPSLASRWNISKDGRTYTFHLRPGVKFSNGQPVTAADVKYSLDRFGNPKLDAAMGSVAVGYGTSKVINTSTIQFHLAKPIAAFLYNISIFPAFVLPKNLVQKEGKAFYNHPVGTGPFIVKQFVKGSHITFVRNPYYWEKGKPYLNSVRFNFATDSNSRILAVRGGSAQIMDGVPFSQIASLEKSNNVRIQSAKVPQFLGLWLNHARAPFTDLNVRKAMQMAIDRQTLKKDILHGYGIIPNSVLMGLKYDAPASVVKPYAFNVKAAKALMAKSKFPKGFSTTLQYPSGYDYYSQLALLLQQNLGAIGIKVKLVEEDPATGTSKFIAMKYDMTFPFASFTSDVTVPDEYSDFLADSTNGLHGFFSNWKDPAIQAMVLKFITTLNDKSRAQQWPKIQQALMNQTPVINVMNLPFINAHTSTTCGTAIDALGSDHLEDTWLSKAKG